MFVPQDLPSKIPDYVTNRVKDAFIKLWNVLNIE